MISRLTAVVIALGLILGAVAMVAAETEETTSLPECAAAIAGEGADAPADRAAAELPAWQAIELTDVVHEETFTIADLRGCAVLLEPMATWCINCMQQMGRVQEALQRIDADDVVVIALSIETDLDPSRLVTYAEESEFPFVFTIASVEMLSALEAEFGRSVVVPPATPHIYIAPDGTFGELITGGSSVDTIVANLELLLEEGTM